MLSRMIGKNERGKETYSAHKVQPSRKEGAPAVSEPVAVKEEPVPKPPSFNFDTINVVDNHLEKTLSKLKVDELEIISEGFSLPKAKKAEMVSELSKHLTIFDNKIVKK